MLKEFTSANFYPEVLQSTKPVLVDFWASWCAPCKAMMPVLETLAAELPHVVVGKLNVEQNSDIAGQYNVMNLPTILVFQGGAVVNAIMGAQTAAQLRSKLAGL